MLAGQLRARREDLLVLAATGLFAAGLCFAGTKLLETADCVWFWRPSAQFLADAVREGRVPLWNPYIGLGRPHLADMQSAVFYPPLYLACLGQGFGSVLLVWLHCALGVFGMRALARALQVGLWQSYFMAACYLASGSLTARWMTGQIQYGWALCYVPALFHYALRTEEAWERRRIARHALLLALQFLCGHPQVFWFTVIGQGVFIVGRALRPLWRQALLDTGRGIFQLAAANAWCAGLVIVLLLPFLELTKQGNRIAATPEFASAWKLQWEHLVSLISPVATWEPRDWINWEMNLFVGPVALLLGLAGLSRVRERNVRGFLAVVGVALLMAVGDSTPIFWLFYKWLPGYSGFRCHSREGLLVVFSLICAAGIWLSRSHPCLRTIWARNFGIPVRRVIMGLVLVQALSLLYATWVIKKTYSYSNIFHVRADHPFQATLVAKMREAGLMAPSRPPPRVCVPWELVPQNYGMIYRYSSFDANCSLFLRRPWAYLHAMVGIQPPSLQNNALQVEIYLHGPFPYPDLALETGLEPTHWTLQFATNVAPRAFLVYAAEVGGDGDTILKRLVQGHDIHRSALLEAPLPELLPRESSLPGAAATIRRFEPNWLLVEVEAKTNALLVLAEAWYPGWRAEVDGRTRACVPANLWMRAVPVPAGRHQVRVYFHQDYLLPGALISLASVGLLLAVMIWPSAKPHNLTRLEASSHELVAPAADLKG
jgi:hypothetical protein